ncbi:hypothetical protein [Algoriphagus sp. AGSA1]|uniref:hypothetical protein n=1 Tax=Algoriphagus sp. AGSA1 TaxID=2907213 RepID=UPI001F32BDB6|nr:hypothetical protein [Algoriphagus sp. AGSA1]
MDFEIPHEKGFSVKVAGGFYKYLRTFNSYTHARVFIKNVQPYLDKLNPLMLEVIFLKQKIIDSQQKINHVSQEIRMGNMMKVDWVLLFSILSKTGYHEL